MYTNHCNHINILTGTFAFQVVSLMDYDDIESALDNDPSPGYPLVCVTVSVIKNNV